MMIRQKWFDHKFQLGIDPGWTENIMCRIKDAEMRIAFHVQGLSNAQLSTQVDNTWSIKEHIGHMIDLEILWMDRFNQFNKKVPELIPTDLENRKTHLANHNDQSIDALLTTFSKEREQLINTFNSLDPDALYHEALHPRLKMPMKPVDLLFFVAEHDNHHITSIIKIKGTQT